MSTSPHGQTDDDSIEILLVEDNPGDVRLTKEALKATAYETPLEVATDGDEAVERLFREADDDSLPDLVLLDLNLPGRDGTEVLEAIRGDERLQGLPVIILTSSKADEDVAKCYDARANAYLTKPTDPAEFSSLMETVERFWFEKVRLPPVPA